MMKKTTKYVEIDLKAINDLKSKKIAEFEAKPHCERQVINLDFTRETTKDITKHGFDNSMPTCWILDGVATYLKEGDV